MQDKIIQNKIMQDETLQDNMPAASISSQVLGKIEIFLNDTMGLHSASIGSFPIASAVQRRMASIDQQCADINIDAETYLVRLLGSTEELDALIEEVVIPETWFFRNQESFSALQHFVSKEWAPAHTQEQLRVLSLPCSTGEEPYSIVMTLIDAGLPRKQFHIDAIDISIQALSHACRAVYNSNAFRSNDLAFRDRFFHHTDAGYLLDKTIRQDVNFIHANMLDAAFMPGQGLYDVIFCRNVMIYFDRITQTQAIAVLSRLLKPTGILFVGHAESGIILNHGYASEHIHRAFAFRKEEPEQRSRPDSYQHPVRDNKKIRSAYQHPARPFATTPKIVGEAPLPTDSLEQAFYLANKGSLVDATSLCETWLQHHEPNVEAYYLLGLIHEAAGHEQQAEECLRKAIYLQPDHQDALLQLALLVEQRGDPVAADVLYQRARRAAEQLSPASIIPTRVHR